MRRAWLWIGGGVVALAVLATAAVLVVRWLAGPPTPSQAEAAQTETAPRPKGLEVKLDKFVTNLNEPGTAIDITLVLVVPGKDEAAQVEEMKFPLRAALIGVLRGLSSRELVGPQGQALVAARALERANQVLGADTVIEVLVTDMVTQP